MIFPRIWVLAVNRRGADLQACALAEEIGLPFETRTLRFNWRYWLSGQFMGASASSVVRELREKVLVAPWPDLIIFAGKRAVPVARWLKKQSGGKAITVMIGNPRVEPHLLDLVYTLRDYPTPSAGSVRLMPLAMSRYRTRAQATEEELAWLGSLPRPRLLLMLGGDTRHWILRPDHAAGVAETLAKRASKANGSLIVVRSARTSETVLDAVEKRLENGPCEWRMVRHDFPRFPVLLDDADMLFPTGDSISMISESIITGKPVGIVPVEMSWRGRLQLGGEQRAQSNRRRDLRRFWNHLIDNGIAGTMDEPKASDTPNPVIEAAQEVRSLLQSRFGKLPG